MSINIILSPKKDKFSEKAIVELKKYFSLIFDEKILVSESAFMGEGDLQSKTILLYLFDDIPDNQVKSQVELQNAEEGFCSIYLEGKGLLLTSKSSRGLLYCVYSLLEELGVGFYSHGDILPLEKQVADFSGVGFKSEPEFSIRGLLNWPDFVSGCTAWGYEEFKNYFDQMVKMKMNFFGIHCYSAEPYLSYEYQGISYNAYLDTTMTDRWWMVAFSYIQLSVQYRTVL